MDLDSWLPCWRLPFLVVQQDADGAELPNRVSAEFHLKGAVTDGIVGKVPPYHAKGQKCTTDQLIDIMASANVDILSRDEPFLRAFVVRTPERRQVVVISLSADRAQVSRLVLLQRPAAQPPRTAVRRSRRYLISCPGVQLAATWRHVHINIHALPPLPFSPLVISYSK